MAHQPALLAGENDDASEDATALVTYDNHATNIILLLDNAENSWPLFDFVPLTPPNYLAVVSLTSRPPPCS
ncbi:MAG: hypothetical protein RI101_11560 [Nitrospira sp.]|nr:hypothetical protein [Nitrospira sp.]